MFYKVFVILVRLGVILVNRINFVFLVRMGIHCHWKMMGRLFMRGFVWLVLGIVGLVRVVGRFVHLVWKDLAWYNGNVFPVRIWFFWISKWRDNMMISLDRAFIWTFWRECLRKSYSCKIMRFIFCNVLLSGWRRMVRVATLWYKQLLVLTVQFWLVIFDTTFLICRLLLVRMFKRVSFRFRVHRLFRISVCFMWNFL